MVDQTGAEQPLPASPVIADSKVAEPEASGGWLTGRLVFWLPVLPLVALDLWSKWFFLGMVDKQGAYVGAPIHNKAVQVWSGWQSFHLVKWYNTGTLWGLFRDFNWALRSLRCLAIVIIIYLAIKTPAKLRLQLLALGLVLSGALGNLYDNFTVGPPEVEMNQEGGVRDFLLFSFGDYIFPAFNVADSCIFCGAVLLLFQVLFRSPPKAT